MTSTLTITNAGESSCSTSWSPNLTKVYKKKNQNQQLAKEKTSTNKQNNTTSNVIKKIPSSSDGFEVEGEEELV